MNRSVLGILVLAAMATAGAGCGTDGPEPSPAIEGAATAGVVARFGDNEITSAEVDARILALPAAERPKPGDDLDQWYTDQIRATAVDRCLLKEARIDGLQDAPAFRAARHTAEKQIGLQLCLAELRPEVSSITEPGLRAAFEARAGEFSVPERRSLYQIFLRRGPGAQQRIETLRERVLAGDGFPRLASENSESETRHRQGFVGWIVPGRLPQGFENVVFGLDEGTPSAVVTTREGFHLFYVDQILPAKNLSFEEARPILLQRLQTERTEAVLADLDTEFEAPPGSLVLDREQLAAVLRSGGPEAPVLRLGDEAWTLADLNRRVRDFMSHEAEVQGAPTVELAWQVLDHARRREELYQGCKSGGHIPSEPLIARVDAWQERALVDAERHRRLVEIALKDDDRLRLYYESNIGDYSTPPTWNVSLLRVPLGDRPEIAMERLETAASTPGSDLTTLTAELGGTIQELGPKTLAEIGSSRPKLPGLLAPLGAGQLSPPYRTEDGFEIAKVVARTDASPIPFGEVRERVAARYVQQYTAELYHALTRDILEGAELRIDPDAVSELRRAGLPQPEISVEELDALLESR